MMNVAGVDVIAGMFGSFCFARRGEREVQEEHALLAQELAALKLESEHSYLEGMKALVQQEKQRLLEETLPGRYRLAAVDIQPLALEYLIRQSEEGR